MNSRMDKYYKENTLEESRTTKNRDIYEKVKEEDFDKLSLTSNISILDTDTTNLDIEKLKNLLEERYTKPKRSAPSIDEEETSNKSEEEEDTKEYDLKKVIEDAHKNKDVDYDKERFKKLRDTQYEILNSLDLNRSDEPVIEESLTVEEANLMNLIKTVNDNSLKAKQNAEDDLMSSLKGGDDTEVMKPLDFEDDDDEDEEEVHNGKKPTILEELEKTKRLSKTEIQNKMEDLSETNEKNLDNEKALEETNTFYTGKLKIDESDLDDFSDLQDEIKSGNWLIKGLIILIVVIIIAVIIFVLNKYLNLGLF